VTSAETSSVIGAAVDMTTIAGADVMIKKWISSMTGEVTKASTKADEPACGTVAV